MTDSEHQQETHAGAEEGGVSVEQAKIGVRAAIERGMTLAELSQHLGARPETLARHVTKGRALNVIRRRVDDAEQTTLRHSYRRLQEQAARALRASVTSESGDARRLLMDWEPELKMLSWSEVESIAKMYQRLHRVSLDVTDEVRKEHARRRQKRSPGSGGGSSTAVRSVRRP